MVKTYGELDDRQIDVLCEVGNIGAGNAATSLSVLLNEGVTISVPKVKILDYDSVIRAVGDPEELGIAIMIQYNGDVNGIILFILSHDDAKDIGDILIGNMLTDEVEEEGVLSDIKLSIVKEIGNILGCAYLGSIATMAGIKFEVSVPYVSIDMVGAILSAPLLLFSIDDNKILLIEESFLTDTRSLKSHVILFADIRSLNTILTRLGIEGTTN